MNRRKLLLGTAASAAAGTFGMRGPHMGMATGSTGTRRAASATQLPAQWEILDLWRNDEGVSVNGQNWIGAVRDISNDGHAIGEVVMDGRFQPVIWDEALTMTVLDMGDHAADWGLGWVINSAGLAGGEVRTTESVFGEGGQLDYAAVPLIWDAGRPVDTSTLLPPDTLPVKLSEAGLFTGESGEAPARWDLTSFETLEFPEGFVYGAARATNAAGAAAGALYRSNAPYSGGVPFIWNADGSVTMLELPEGRGPDWAGILRPVLLTDSGEVVAHVIDGEAYFGALVRYANGTQTTIPDAFGEGARLFDANASGVLLGESSLGGLTIPTVWIDDQPIVIADRIVPGPDRLLTNVSGINDAGAIVGSASDSAGVPYSVLLRPV